MTQPKPPEQYDTGERFALLDAIRAELDESERKLLEVAQHQSEARRLIVEWDEQSGCKTVPNLLIDVVGVEGKSSAGIMFGAEEPGE